MKRSYKGIDAAGLYRQYICGDRSPRLRAAIVRCLGTQSKESVKALVSQSWLSLVVKLSLVK